ncbi:hypothetical protein F4813DRAFT_389550 [Daldinia decipiens]|uniref:uncharacterized protein n=1 Tax=Daldinia decipiens TaxID=326647 RepID=UPI0020C5764D|nr:uncharacterized protein F4813DRAFT_389550 [Daldinia decipiens]KAI1657809.1 hypothetical protein F4813DRAFT_389550 [Daldinia decipiens]
MLRRPPTTLTLTAEDVAAYEDRRFAAMQAQSQNQTSSRATSHPLQPQPTAMDTSSSSATPSPPRIEDDEDMQDVDVDVDADEADTSDPFVMAPRRAAREQFSRREQSPGQARAAYLQQMRATRGQHTTPTAPAPSTRMQRITGTSGSTGQTGRTTGTARSATSRQGSTEPTTVAPPQAPRMMTRSREERIGIAGSTAGTGSRRR